MKSKKAKHDRILSAMLIGAALLLTLALILPDAAFHTIGDGISRDGRMESLTAERIHWLKMGCGGALVICLSLFAWLLIKPCSFHAVSAFLRRTFQTFPAQLRHDGARLGADARTSLRRPKAEWLALLAILLCGIALRSLILNRPMQHDECYTVATWASGDFRYATSDYHLPNNHIFHTILVWIVVRVLGMEPWMTRLPAFLAGLFLILVVYQVGRSLYSPRAGLFAAGLCAFAPMLVDYSVNARGYALFALFAALQLLCAFYLSRKRNVIAALCLILSAVSGFYTVPMTLYPFGAICVWLFLNVFLPVPAANGDPNAWRGPWQRFAWLMIIGLTAGLLTILCYLPVFLNSGLDAVFNNVFVRPLEAGEFRQTMIARTQDNFQAFCGVFPPWFRAVMGIGGLVSLFFNHRCCRAKIAPQLGFLLWLPPIILLQKPNLWPRTQIYLLPLLIIWSAGGLVYLMTRLTRLFTRGKREARWLIPWLLTLLTLIAAIPEIRSVLDERRSAHSPQETAVRLMMEEGLEDPLFVAAPEDDAVLWYYAARAGLNRSLFSKQSRFSSLYVYVNPINEAFEGYDTLDRVLEAFGPGEAFIIRPTERILIDEPNCRLYWFNANGSAVDKAYGAKIK